MVYSICTVMTQQAMLQQEIVRRVEVVADMASLLAAEPLTSQDSTHIEMMNRSLGRVPEITSVCLYGRTGTPLAGGLPLSTQNDPKPDCSATTISEDSDHYDICIPVRQTSLPGNNLTAGETRSAGANDAMLGWVGLVFSKERMKKTQMQIILRGVIITLVLTAGSGSIVYILLLYAARPLRQLSTAVKNVRDGCYTEIAMSSPDEIGDLASEFNRMSRAINKREELLVSRAQCSQLGADVGGALVESSSLAEMAQKCAELICFHTGSRCVAVWGCNRGNETLHLMAGGGAWQSSAFPSDRLSVGEGSAGTIAQRRQPFATKDPADHPMFANKDFLVSNGIRFFAGYPLVVESKLIGVIELFAEQPLSWDLLNTIGTLTDQMAAGFERKIIEERMRISLEEKEVLLREIHHRVKNNMQVISSLLNLQAETIADRTYQDMLSESKNRIRAMALIHEKLYQTPDIAKIDFGDYISSLASGLFMFYGASASRVTLALDAQGIVLGIDRAMPCGLIINELLSNALKYAFPNGRGGRIEIAMRKDETAGRGGALYRLAIRDDGVGLPEGFDFRTPKSLGLYLVTSLVEHQLRGSITVEEGKGAKFTICFGDAGCRKKV